MLADSLQMDYLNTLCRGHVSRLIEHKCNKFVGFIYAWLRIPSFISVFVTSAQTKQCNTKKHVCVTIFSPIVIPNFPTEVYLL